MQPPPFHPCRPSLVRPVRIDPLGLAGPTPGQARGPHWRQTSRGLFVPSDVEPTAQQRTVEAAAVLRAGEAVTGWAGLHWLGARWFDDEARREVPLVAVRHLVAQPGFSVSQEFLAPYDIDVVDAVPFTSAVRSVVFEMRYAATLSDAIAAIDMACYSDLVSIEEVASFVADLGPLTGIGQARAAIAEADENAWSPRETMMRGVWTQRAGLPRPLGNMPVFTLDGRHIGTPDLIDDEIGLVGLYNGAGHITVAGVAADERANAAYRRLGLEVVTMVASDWRDIEDFVERLLDSASRARSRSSNRNWTVDPPRWWTPTTTVARRRALTDSEKQRYLRYRRAA